VLSYLGSVQESVRDVAKAIVQEGG
jgi:hypothetical protein